MVIVSISTWTLFYFYDVRFTRSLSSSNPVRLWFTCRIERRRDLYKCISSNCYSSLNIAIRCSTAPPPFVRSLLTDKSEIEKIDGIFFFFVEHSRSAFFFSFHAQLLALQNQLTQSEEHPIERRNLRGHDHRRRSRWQKTSSDSILHLQKRQRERMNRDVNDEDEDWSDWRGRHLFLMFKSTYACHCNDKHERGRRWSPLIMSQNWT